MSDLLARLSGGVAVITGAGSGIGEGLARYAAELGMKVVLADIARERIEKVSAEIEAAGGTALAVPTDVSDPAAIDRLADEAYEAFGEVTLLVNNAGVETLGFVWEIPASTWERTLAINIHGAIHGVRAFAPRMIAAGRQAFIANTSSIGALGIMPVQTSYILSKHALLAFSECLHLEMKLKKLPISVSVILPGPVATRIFSDSEGADDPVSNYHRQLMDGMLRAEGISGPEAARRILPQIAAGEFWVSTHPEITREFAANRASHLAELATPELPPEVLATLGTVQ
ncbi:MAG: SDR family NAD(P)-dependent oxidoreductase [Pseudomonadales bacterium]|nr:SDR family NAD(P)-dependent oxidoreductase [Pseudomonadales bacterium]MCP5190276.1 SDR family NAD(P)-dependent oxidoreductase [Pseudomonadales bacterium]